MKSSIFCIYNGIIIVNAKVQLLFVNEKPFVSKCGRKADYFEVLLLIHGIFVPKTQCVMWTDLWKNV